MLQKQNGKGSVKLKTKDFFSKKKRKEKKGKRKKKNFPAVIAFMAPHDCLIKTQDLVPVWNSLGSKKVSFENVGAVWYKDLNCDSVIQIHNHCVPLKKNDVWYKVFK